MNARAISASMRRWYRRPRPKKFLRLWATILSPWVARTFGTPLERAAVHAEALSGDVRRMLRHDEAHGIRDLFGRAHVSERAPLVQCANVPDAHRALDQPAAHLRVDESRCDDVHVDAVSPFLS